ncbi:terminase large subunit domain-containing protein [Miltoncostaea marina]|uniref:terminase large subunit domain-containing protein n=1 Tax=Miltoncostaea marina TaxID=2843215 RepID=UPI001C3D117A|nr:terminase large subunit [Miltoncostaea marina]
MALEDALALGRLMVLDTGEHWEPEPFQVAVIDALCRGVDRVWLEIPEGNAKTTLAAAVAIIHLFFVPDADAPVAAASRDQTNVLLRQALGLVRRSPGLPERFRCFEGYRRITCPGSAGRLQVFAADAGTGDGVIPTLAILEELHRHPSLELYRTWSGKLLKRRGQILIISTAGEPGAEYEQAKTAAIEECARQGEVHREPGLTVATMPGFEMRLHALAADEDLEDLEAVKRANPLRAITIDSLQAKRSEPTWNRQHWARFTCGRPARDNDSAIAEAEWLALERELIPAGEPVAVGADFGWKHDTTALVPLWTPAPDRRVLGVPRIVVPPRDGTSTEPARVREAFIAIHRVNPITVVAMDASAGGAQIAEWLEAEPGTLEDGSPDYEQGLGVEVVEVPPTNTVQTKVYDAWMEAVRNRWIRHPFDDQLTQHVLNAIAKPVSHDRYRFDRPNPSRAARHQDRRVIDALIAGSSVHWQQTASLDDKPPPLDLSAYRITTL